MIQDYLSRAKQAQQQLQKTEFKQYNLQGQDVGIEQLIAKLSFLQAENEKLQELLVVERKSKEKYRNMAELKSQIFGRTFYEVELQEQNDQIIVLQRNLDLLQTFFFNTSEQLNSQSATKYETQMDTLRSDLKEACTYNIMLMGELGKNPLSCIADGVNHQQTQVDLGNTDVLLTRIDELQTQVSFLKDSIQSITSTDKKDNGRKEGDNQSQKQVINLEKQLKQSYDETARLIRKLKDKDETIVQLMASERRLQQQGQESTPFMKQNSMISNKTLFTRSMKSNSDQLNAKFNQVVKKMDDEKSQHSHQSQQSDSSISLDRDLKVLNAHLSQKTSQLMKAQADLQRLQAKLTDVDELTKQNVGLQETISSLKNREIQLNLEMSQQISLLQNCLNEKQDEIHDLNQKVEQLNHNDIQLFFVEEELAHLKEELAIQEKIIRDTKKQTIQVIPASETVFELAQKCLLPQLLPKKLTVHTIQYYDQIRLQIQLKGLNFVTQIQWLMMKQHKQRYKNPPKNQINLILKPQSFVIEMDGRHGNINSYDIIELDFDYKKMKIGLLRIDYRGQYHQTKMLKMTGLDVGSFYATIAYRYKLIQTMDGEKSC